MNIVQRHGLLCPVADLQQLPQAVCDKRKVDAVEDVRRIFPIPTQIAGGNAKVVGLPILRQHLQREAVVDVLHHPVDGAGQLILVVQIPQMTEMPLILIAAQRVLDVAGNGGVHVFVGAFLAGKGRGLVVVDAAETHGAAVADILIDAVNAEDRFKLSVRDECGVQQDAAVVKLLVLGKEKAQRVRAGEHNLHAAGRKHVRKQRCALDEILHQRHLVEEHIAKALRFQCLEVAVHVCQCVFCCDLNERCLGKLCVVHLRENLADHGGFPRPAQAVEDEHLVLRLTVDKVVQLQEALAPAIAANRRRKGTQRLAGADIGGKRGRARRFCLGQLLFQRLQFLLQFLPPLDLRTEILQFVSRNILLPPLLVLRPTVVEIVLTVDGFLRNRTSRQSRNLLFQLRRPGLHLG